MANGESVSSVLADVGSAMKYATAETSSDDVQIDVSGTFSALLITEARNAATGIWVSVSLDTGFDTISELCTVETVGLLGRALRVRVLSIDSGAVLITMSPAASA
jgi:hypothetical protein